MSFLPDFSTIDPTSAIAIFFAMIALGLYAYSVFTRPRYSLSSEMEEEMRTVAQEMSELQRTQQSIRLENDLLREFLVQEEHSLAVNLLLRQFVMHPTDGFVLFVEYKEEASIIRRSRGYAGSQDLPLPIDYTMIDSMHAEDIVILQRKDLVNTELFESLTIRDRAKVDVLYLLPIKDRDGLFAYLVTTTLFPSSLDFSSQMRLAIRLMQGISGRMRQSLVAEAQSEQLAYTKEMLALRSIADQHAELPSQMMDEFLQRLSSIAEVDRAVVYIYSKDRTSPLRPIFRSGKNLGAGVIKRWSDYEDVLAQEMVRQQVPLILQDAHLNDLGISMLMGSGIVMPLKSKQQMLGVIALTRSDRGRFTKNQIELVQWASQYLSETILKAAQVANMQRESREDGLTRLANRRTFDNYLKQEVENASKTGREVSLCLFDLDKFKTINDTHGHQAGDAVLKAFSEIILSESSHVRATDRPLAARYGGEELALILPGVGIAGATRIAESIRQALECHSVLHSGKRIWVTTSAGIGCYPRHAGSMEELISKTDVALYHAKESGRNRVRTTTDIEVEPGSPDLTSAPPAEESAG